MSRLAKFNRASFRGFVFLVESESTNRGKKLAIHEYPNLDDRFAEGLGKFPPVLNLTCIIHGDDLIQRRLEFERVLELPGVGELIHPAYGSIQATAGEYTVSASQREIGKFVFNVPFYKSREKIEPTPLAATPETASNTADAARAGLANALEAAYVNPEKGFDLANAVSAMEDTLDAVQNSIDAIINPIQEGIAAAQSAINSFRNKINRIMQTATEFKSRITNLYNSILQAADISDLQAAWEKLIDFGIPPETGAIDTARRLNNATNRSIIAEHTRLTGLLGLIEANSNTEFLTDEGLREAQTLTDSRFAEYFLNNALNVVSLADNPLFRSLAFQLRFESKIVLDTQLPNLFKLVDVAPGRTSIPLMLYRYYGNFDNENILIRLNPSVNVANFNATVKAITR